MRTRPVHWSEGMLVLPHHFQAAQSNLLDWLATSQDWIFANGYGIRALEINLDALKNFEVRVPRLQARLKDGTLLAVPENAHLPILDLKSVMSETPEVYLQLALPEVIAGKANAARQGDGQRFLTTTEEWEDRNDGGNPRPIETHRHNARLLATPTRDAPKGFESIPLVKLRRAQTAEAPPEIDESYIPPLLSCDAWKPLKEGVLASINAKLGAFIKTQAEYLRTHGGWSEANQPQIRMGIMQLFAINSSYPYLTQLTLAAGVHPFLLYTELCRLLGQLSLFRPDWQPPELPKYDHDDLARIFRQIKIELDPLCQVAKGKVQRYPFMGIQDWMEVTLDPNWMRGHRFYVGARSELPPELLEKLFSNKWLDWKLGSPRSILKIYEQGLAGVPLKRVLGVHATLPALANVTYFEIVQEGVYWEEVAETRGLALKVNERYVRGNFVGQSTITVVDPKNQSRDLGLELFVVKNE